MSIQTHVIGGAAAPPSVAVALRTPWLVRRAWQAVAAVLVQHAIWRAEADLMALGDRALKDIGLTRGEIQSAVREALAADDFAARLSRSARL
jgi:uncharacterized protein YjiS (DUF1127 family)